MNQINYHQLGGIRILICLSQTQFCKILQFAYRLFSQLADVMTDVSQLAYQLGVWKRCLSVCVMYVKHISPPSILHRLQPDLDKHDLGRGR